MIFTAGVNDRAIQDLVRLLWGHDARGPREARGRLDERVPLMEEVLALQPGQGLRGTTERENPMTSDSRIWCSFCGQIEDILTTLVEWPHLVCEDCFFIFTRAGREQGKSYAVIKLP